MQINNFIKKHPYLVWYTNDYQHLSREAIVEAVLNYGDWDDVQEVISILGMKKTAAIFRRQTERPRVNYDPKIINYFGLYFKKYVPGFKIAQRNSNPRAKRTFAAG